MSELNYPDNLLYHPEHTWLRIEDGNTAYVGISDFAQDQLGEVAFVDLPSVGDEFEGGASFGTVESIKAVNDLYMPVSGKVTAVNGALSDEPSAVNASPYGDGWMLRIEIADGADKSKLLDASAYRDILG